MQSQPHGQPMNAATNSIDLDAVIAEIDDRGYCVLQGVISPERADQARTILEGLLQAEIDDGARESRHQRVGGIAHKDPVFLELMCHPLIVSLWKRYLGDDIMCSSWTANTIYPGHDAIGWHADYPFWSLKPPWPAGRFAGQTMWLLDDFTEENGATGTIPFSHRKGHPPDAPTDRWRPEGEILTGRRGSVVVAHGAWWHTSRPNRSDRPRSCLLGMYLMPWFIPQEDMRSQLARIDDPGDLATQLLCGNQHRPSVIGE